MVNRRALYCELNTRLSQFSDAQLTVLLNASTQTKGWGKNQVLKLGKHKVFVKRVPLTNLEYQHCFSTQNLYDLPTFYNYGVGSAGFGVFRELLTHIKTTNWVLSEQIANFPLMYHYRILNCPPIDPKGKLKYKSYIEYWNGNTNIARYISERKKAKHEVVLFLEYFPHTFGKWIAKNSDKINGMVEEMRDIITFLRTKKIIHFDMHFYNLLTDGKHPYLTDFGLTLDQSFHLSDVEQKFFKQNTYYDYGEMLWSVMRTFMIVCKELPKKKKKLLAALAGIQPNMNDQEQLGALLQFIEKGDTNQLFKLDNAFFDLLKKHKESILLFNDFFFGMRATNKKDIPFPNRKLMYLLKQSGFL